MELEEEKDRLVSGFWERKEGVFFLYTNTRA